MARQKAREEREAATKVALDKATSELRSASAASEGLTKHHAKDLWLKEEHLVAKHREELEKVVEAATTRAQGSVHLHPHLHRLRTIKWQPSMQRPQLL
jgi:hypothetical protein